MGVISWQPVLLININLWKSTSPLVPYLGPRLPRPLHYSEPMGHLMNLIFKPLMFCEVWSVPLQSLKGTFLTALPWGHCCLLQGVLSPRWSNPQASFTCFAGIHIALAVRGTILVLFLPFWVLAGMGEEDTGESYLTSTLNSARKSFHIKQPY